VKKNLFVLCLTFVMLFSLTPLAAIADEGKKLPSSLSPELNTELSAVKPTLPGLVPGGIAKTSPPPVAITPFSLVDPSFQYLTYAQGNITYDSKTKRMRISGTTIATTTVDKIISQVTLERWTGSKWESVHAGNYVQLFDTASHVTSVDHLYPALGYYYRTKLYTIVYYGDVFESATTYSYSLLYE